MTNSSLICYECMEAMLNKLQILYQPADGVCRHCGKQRFGVVAIPLAVVTGSGEICICSAVISTTGEIIRGHRHSDCMSAMRDRGLALVRHPSAKGFITSLNRYVTKEEGFRLQLAAGIPSCQERGYSGSGSLFSEDLY